MKKKIYTAGKMAGLSLDEQMSWRLEFERCLKDMLKYRGIPHNHVRIVHPPVYYTYGRNYHKTEREVKNWDLNQVRASDIVVVKLDDVSSSIGTHYELATVDAINSFGNKHIFVIGVGDSNVELHPWIEDTLHRREESFEDASQYIVDYLLV